MSDVTFAVRMDLPREALAEERSVAAPGYELGQESALPPDPDALEAHFIEPVTLIATVTVAMLAWRIVNHFLVKDGRGFSLMPVASRHWYRVWRMFRPGSLSWSRPTAAARHWQPAKPMMLPLPS